MTMQLILKTNTVTLNAREATNIMNQLCSSSTETPITLFTQPVKLSSSEHSHSLLQRIHLVSLVHILLYYIVTLSLSLSTYTIHILPM
ncbi:hypothetical protein BCR42DRAFT_129389 [Absidia repens]|uniref:Uncharacterized protein n=1 Tax=Absidia repens TaxID=90262 RepID=A0A1X2IVS0_9FUNG|nr:hypothetical protein BCR42DRAFT_129389 [Absidia repens]